MTTQLLWTGTDDVDVFVDAENNDEYHSSERPHDVPDERVDWLLDHEGWERPDAQAAAETVRTLPANEPVDADDDADADADSESDGDGDAVSEAESDAEGAAEPFDADAFIDDSWQSVQAAIRGGEVDNHLAAVEAAEQERDGGPREDSVLEAIDQRRGEVNAE